ncbi:MAG: TrmB family transcriptional regulator [Halobacteriales archaeon]
MSGGDRPEKDPSVTGEEAAVEALKRLGLSTYAARAFVALQRLESGSASEVAEIADVPRSQVYGAAEELEERGLIDVQQGTPTRYRPVDVAEARERLYEEIRREGDAAFAYVESVRGEHASEEEQGEAIWTVGGGETIATRVATLVGDAGADALYGVDDPERLEDPVLDALRAAIDRGVDVTVVSAEAAVLEAAREAIDGVETGSVPREMDPEIGTGRVLLVDDDTLLMSVLPTEVMPHLDAETAFWSSETGFATLLVAILREWFGGVTGR